AVEKSLTLSVRGVYCALRISMVDLTQGAAPPRLASRSKSQGRAAGRAQLDAARAKDADPARERVRRGSVQSVDRALALIEVLAGSPSGLPLTELTQQASLNISTGHHLLATLIKWGYVARTSGRRYALGARGLHLAQAFLKQVDLPRRAQAHADRISEETGETVRLAVLQGDAVMTLLTREGRHAVRVDAGAVGYAG